MKKLLYLILFAIGCGTVYCQKIPTSKKFRDLQPGLYSMFLPYKDTTEDEFLLPKSCYPYDFETELWDTSTVADTLQYNWCLDTVCVISCYAAFGGSSCTAISTTDAICIYEGDKLKKLHYKQSPFYDMLIKWDTVMMNKEFINANDSTLAHIHGGGIDYYSRAIIENGKIIKYDTLPKVVFRPEPLDNKYHLNNLLPVQP